MYVVVTAEQCDDDAIAWPFVHGAFKTEREAIEKLSKVAKGLGFDPEPWETDDKYAPCGRNRNSTLCWSEFDSEGGRTFKFMGRVIETEDII